MGYFITTLSHVRFLNSVILFKLSIWIANLQMNSSIAAPLLIIKFLSYNGVYTDGRRIVQTGINFTRNYLLL